MMTSYAPDSIVIGVPSDDPCIGSVGLPASTRIVKSSGDETGYGSQGTGVHFPYRLFQLSQILLP